MALMCHKYSFVVKLGVIDCHSICLGQLGAADDGIVEGSQLCSSISGNSGDGCFQRPCELIGCRVREPFLSYLFRADEVANKFSHAPFSLRSHLLCKVHTCGNSKKATCPYCRQRIASQTLNLSLQKLIDSLTALQRKPSWTAVHPLDRDGLPERLAGVETRCNILRTELVETVESKEGLDEALQEVDERLENLHAREMELSDMVNAIQATQQGVQRETEETQVTRCAIVTKQEEVTAKINLIEATLLALERVSTKKYLELGCITMFINPDVTKRCI